MAASSRRPSVIAEVLTPEERELRLKQWLQRKELLDKGLEVTAKLLGYLYRLMVVVVIECSTLMFLCSDVPSYIASETDDFSSLSLSPPSLSCSPRWTPTAARRTHPSPRSPPAPTPSIRWWATRIVAAVLPR
jgi:hypothetical protein